MTRVDLPPDFKAIFESCPGGYLILTPQLRITAVSDAYLRATMTTREQILGRDLFDVFPDNPDDPGATGTANLRASLGRVLEHKRPDRMAIQKYDIRRPESEGGGFEERHWSPLNTPVIDVAGRVTYIVHSVEDVTDVVRLTRQGDEQGRALREFTTRSEMRYRQLLDMAPDAMAVVGADGRIRMVNVQTEKLFGYPRSELIGQALDILVPDRLRDGHAAHVAAFIAHPSARPMGSGLELFGRRKDGSELAIEVSLSPLQDHDMAVSASIRDIGDRKRLEADARLNADRLASAVDTMQDAVALFDGADRLVLCNSVYRRLLDKISGPIVGKSYVELLDAWIDQIAFNDADERASYRLERLAHHHDSTNTFQLRLNDGRSLRVTDRRTPEGGIIKTIWDLTDDERQAEELREARAAAEAGSAAKSEFLSSMSHELRTPLNAILGFAQLLRRDKREPLSTRHLDRVEHILAGGEHLLRLIDDVLDLSRIEAGRVSISTEPVGVREVLEAVRRALEPIATRQTVRIEVEQPATGAPTMVLADRTRFMQILMNFGSNAIKYNRPSGKVSYVVSAPTPGKLRVTVRDTGMGIPLEQQHKLFQPFQRAGQETGPIEGTGIGLVISRRLASLMRGDIGFHSVPGEGSEFWVDLPLQQATAPAPAPRPTVRDADRQLTIDGHQLVLYVEDNPANVTFMQDLLSTLDGIDLIVAPTAEIGVELARTRLPAVILMDINLPGMSGIEALHALRASQTTADIPVIALTAAASERDRQHGIQAGFFRYLTKPLRVDELVDALQSALAPAESVG